MRAWFNLLLVWPNCYSGWLSPIAVLSLTPRLLMQPLGKLRVFACTPDCLSPLPRLRLLLRSLRKRMLLI